MNPRAVYLSRYTCSSQHLDLSRPSMAPKGKRPRAGDPLSDKSPSKKTRTGEIHSRLSSTETRPSLDDRCPTPFDTTKPNASYAHLPLSQNKKRRREEQHGDSPASKKTKFSGFSPAFYDNLSKTWLTRRALRELERRNKNSRPSGCASAVGTQRRSKLAAFARLGGPDLSDIRGVCLSTHFLSGATPTAAAAGLTRLYSIHG